MHYRTRLIAGVLGLGLVLAWGMMRSSPANAAGAKDLSREELAGGRTIESCEMCHTMDPVRSHPVGVVPTGMVPGGLPLVDGAVSCTTCHLSDYESHLIARVDRKGMLRPELAAGGAAACAVCHEPAMGGRSAMHALSVGRAHLRGRSFGLSGSLSARRVSIDTQSQSCVACHDGVVSSDVEYSTAPNPVTMGIGAHPIGVRVGAGMMTDPRVHLEEGRVACVTCHSPYSKEKKQLVMSNVGSQLCLTCHSRM